MLEDSSEDVAIARRYRTSLLGNASMSGPEDEYLSIKVIGVGVDGTHAVAQMVNNRIEGAIQFAGVSNAELSADCHELRFQGTALAIVVVDVRQVIDVTLAETIAHTARAADTLVLVIALTSSTSNRGNWNAVQSLVQTADATVSLLNVSTDGRGLNRPRNELFATVSAFAGAFGPDAPVCADFEDVHAALGRRGVMRLGMNACTGTDRAKQAAHRAMTQIGLVSLYRAESVVVFISGNRSMRLREFAAVMRAVRYSCSSTTSLTLGVSYDEALAESLNVLLLAADVEN